MSDKEIALELTSLFMDHMTARASSNNVSKSHVDDPRIIASTYEMFYKSVSNLADK